MEIIEERSFWSIVIGLIFICMAIASLLTVRGLSKVPESVTINLTDRNFFIDVHNMIFLLATPSRYIASVWGEESMVISMAFLFLGLGLSFIFKKKIASRIRTDKN